MKKSETIGNLKHLSSITISSGEESCETIDDDDSDVEICTDEESDDVQVIGEPGHVLYDSVLNDASEYSVSEGSERAHSHPTMNRGAAQALKTKVHTLESLVKTLKNKYEKVLNDKVCRNIIYWISHKAIYIYCNYTMNFHNFNLTKFHISFIILQSEEIVRLKNDLKWKDEQLGELNQLVEKNMELEARIKHMLSSKQVRSSK